MPEQTTGFSFRSGQLQLRGDARLAGHSQLHDRHHQQVTYQSRAGQNWYGYIC